MEHHSGMVNFYSFTFSKIKTNEKRKLGYKEIQQNETI